MKKLLLSLAGAVVLSLSAVAQCTLTNATTCKCPDSTMTDCDLIPDIKISVLPLTQAGNYTEYPQVCSPPCSGNDGRLRLGVSTPIIGFGPLETRGTTWYVCGTDTIDAGTIANIPSICPSSGLPPHQLIVQRIYRKSGSVMNYVDKPAGSMTYHASHGHQHVDGWGIYTLRSSTIDPNPLNWPIIGTGTKLAFCLLDIGSCSGSVGYCTDDAGNTLTSANFNTPHYRNYGLGGGSYGCSNTVQGISNGYLDTYSKNLDGMWINIPPALCNGTYYVVVQVDPYNYFVETNENNNVVVVPYTLTQQAGGAATITASGPTSFCQGGSVTLTATGGALNYLWSNGATTRAIVVSASGSFSVSINTNTTCATSSTPVTVSVSPMSVTASSTASSICEGQSVQLSTSTNAAATANQVAVLTNNTQVFIPDNNATGVTSITNVSGISPSVLGANSIVSVTLNLTHTYDGDLIISLISPSGNTINLSNRRGGSGNNFTNTVFTMSATTNIGSGVAPFTGSYVPDGAFSSLTGNANGDWKLKVADVAATDTGRIQNWTLRIYNTVANVVTYNWTSNPTGFGSSLQNPVASPGVSTTYTVNTSDLNGCAGNSSVSIAVNPNPVVTVSPDATICDGQSTTLTASGATDYLWSPGNETTSGIVVSPSATTVYTVTGTSSGCTSTNTVNVTVNPSLAITVSPGVTICDGSSTTLSASGATDYLWSPGSETTASIVVSPNSTTTYSVTGTSAGCTGSNTITVTVDPSLAITVSSDATICEGSNTTLSASGATDYLWSPGNETTASIVVSPASTTTYTVTGTSAGCSGSNTTTVTVNPLPVVSSSSNSPVCEGSTLQLYSSAGINYSWTGPNGFSSSDQNPFLSNSSLAAGGNYTVTVTGANGCVNNASTNASVNPNPVLALSATNVSCNGGSDGTVTVSATNGTPNYNYLWNTVPAQTTATAVNLAAGTYTVTVTDANNCGASTSQAVASPAVLAATGVVTNAGCTGATDGSIDLTPSGGTPTYSFFWSPGGLTNEDISGIGSGNYSVLITDGNSCTTTQNFTIISSLTPPSAPTSVSGNSIICRTTTGNIYSISPVAGAASYTWSVPSGATISSGQGTTSVSVTFSSSQASGNICVFATNGCGNSASTCKALMVTTAKPARPSGISGPLSVCKGTSGNVYTCPPVSNAQSYNWVAPTGFTITGGAGTNSITVTVSPSFTSGQLKVSAVNCIGSSAQRNQSVTGISVPATPASITGAAAVCANQAGVPYSTTSVSGATSYLWGVPVGASVVSGQGTTSVIINFGSASGNVSVSAVNICGPGIARTKPVTINCRLSEPVNDLSLFPNPAHDKINLEFYSTSDAEYQILLRDITGRLIYTKKSKAVMGQNKTELSLMDFAKGVYLLSFETGDMRLVKTVIVE